MSSKLSDKDEVALLMQQQGLSRVQATKMLYEMAKQKKKEEAAASNGSLRQAAPGASPQQVFVVIRRFYEVVLIVVGVCEGRVGC
jgi:hypothetical protein